MKIVDILDRERDVTRTYEDGSFECPFCAAAVIAPAARCSNPGCSASIYAMANPACRIEFEKRAIHEKLVKETRERSARDHAVAMERLAKEGEERTQRLRDAVAEADRRGACRRCLWPRSYSGYGTPKYIKHRGACPRTGG